MYESHGFPTPKHPIEDSFGARCYLQAVRMARGEELTQEEWNDLEKFPNDSDYGSYLCWSACVYFRRNKREMAFRFLEDGVKYFDTLPTYG